MNRWMGWMGALTMLFFVAVGQAADPGEGRYLPMPPVFSLDAKSDQLLKEYPLGVITKEAAFAHHGQAHNVVTLPNGLEGWVYENLLTKQETFTTPSGQKREVKSLEHTNVLSTYTLVFGPDGKVIDVLYRDNRGDDAASALLAQRKLKPDVENEPWRSKHREME